MKKRLFFFSVFILLIIRPVQVQSISHVMIIGQEEEAVSNFCSSCTPGDPCDQFCEDWEGSQDIATTGPNGAATCTGWTGGDDGDGTITKASHDPGGDALGCTGKGLYYLELANINSDLVWMYKDLAAAKSAVYLKFYAYVFQTNVDNNDLLHSLQLFNEAASTRVYVDLRFDGTDWSPRLQYNGGADKSTMTADFLDATWWEWEITYISGTQVKLSINDGTNSETIDITTDVESENIKTIRFSVADLNIGEGESAGLGIDCLCVDDDALPGDCAGTSP